MDHWGPCGDFGVMLNPCKKGKWKELMLWNIRWNDLLSVLDVKRSTDPFVSTNKYNCPPHLVRIIQDHDILRETQQSLLIIEDPALPREREWKLQIVIKSCLAAERLDIEGRTAGSRCLTRSEKSQLPRPLDYSMGVTIYAGFQFQGKNRFFNPRIQNMVSYGRQAWQIGLIIRWTRPERVKWDLRECLIQMRTTQLTRKKRGEQAVNMYGIVSSGDLIQIHKLSDTGELQSSAVMLLTTEGLPTIWQYLRHIIHEVQIKASPPPNPKDTAESCKQVFRVEQIILAHHYGLKPDGTPRAERSESGGGARDSKEVSRVTRLRRQWVKRFARVASDAECDREVRDESDTGPEDWYEGTRPYVYPSTWRKDRFGANMDYGSESRSGTDREDAGKHIEDFEMV